MEVYCLKCKQKQEANDMAPVVLKNGHDAQQGTCSVCGTKVMKMGKA